MSKKSEYGKECPKCTGYMHQCEQYVPAVYAPLEKGAMRAEMLEPAKGCFGQAINATGTRNHEEGNWWRCLFCDYWEPLEVKALAKVSK